MKDSPQTPRDIVHTLDRFAAERRRFLAEGSVYGAGILASLGLSQYVRAQGAPPPAGSAPAPFVRPPPPPEPAFAQRAPLHDLKGKVAYITASSDGIGLGIARAASAAGGRKGTRLN